VATDLTSLGAVLYGLGEPAAARPLLERALHIHEVACSPDPAPIALTLGVLGKVLRTLGEPAGGSRLLERALHIVETKYGPDDPWVASLLTHLQPHKIMLELTESTALSTLSTVDSVLEGTHTAGVRHR
jgi:hypothetical protein